MANKNSSEATLVAIFREYRNLSWSERLLGKYDYRQLCTPVLIGNETENRSTFFGKDEPIPILLAILMGFQHALGSVGGNVLIVTLATFGAPPTIREYLLSCAFIVSGIVSMLQIAALPVPFTSGRLQIGTGLLSLVGSSSAFVSLFMTQVYGQIVRDPTLSWQQAYGGVVGALMTSSLIGLGMAALPPKALRRLLPPVVSGTTVVLIGTSLADSALQYWGGGILCSRFVQIPAGGCQVVNPATGAFEASTNCYMAPGTYPCSGNGDVKLPFGSLEYLGFGFATLVIVILVEMFGSPFFRSASGVTALLGGFAFAACFTYEGARYVNFDQLEAAPWFTFLWVEPIPLSFYLPAFLPGLVLSVVDLLDTVGDVSATSEVSRVSPTGKQHMKRIKGAMLADVLATLLSGLAGGMPVTTYSQNNGIISMSNCASRIAGLFCCAWLIMFGVFAKFGAFFATIPNCVLGGISAYVIGNVIVSGIKILCLEPATRRNRVILATSLVLGIGIEMVPQLLSQLWVAEPGSNALVAGLSSSIVGMLQNGVSLGALVGVLLNLVMPMSTPEELDAVRSIGDELRGMVLPTTSAPSQTPLVVRSDNSPSARSTGGASSSDTEPTENKRYTPPAGRTDTSA
eukprot:jgi/Tetstr1/434606/TSEL_023697.t1